MSWAHTYSLTHDTDIYVLKWTDQDPSGVQTLYIIQPPVYPHVRRLHETHKHKFSRAFSLVVFLYISSLCLRRFGKHTSSLLAPRLFAVVRLFISCDLVNGSNMYVGIVHVVGVEVFVYVHIFVFVCEGVFIFIAARTRCAFGRNSICFMATGCFAQVV